eukprot:CAMPEP_0196592900 /NCGR_PEP_ID=MMETSP1081-20130531/74141_1 /TAXON_ID=36882 /ORGANISM="Pyramimonas amylifera, Strain CCMP720" /LENGTH=951 /DNA_ID=CAMNT_0041916723 /DNA_START=257 /DNA_END=3112 /DNA_ORIENTATION=-
MVTTDKYSNFGANRTYQYDTGFVVEYYDTVSEKECSTSFILIPGVSLWPNSFRIILYALSLVYSFLGIAIISDVFMGAIDTITSQEKTVTLASGEKATIKYWNDTVANLTLMALGSSAPEILLATIETIGTLDTQPGELGPSTIVGSAAFNLLAITAVCIYSIPDGEVRRIADLGVFLMTAFWSVWSYLWMLIVLQVWTPGVVTVTEALLTLLAFPLFVMLSFAQDKKWWRTASLPHVHMADVRLVNIHMEAGNAEVEAEEEKDESTRKIEMKQIYELLNEGQHRNPMLTQIANLRDGDQEKAYTEMAKRLALSLGGEKQEMSMSKFRLNARRMIVGQRFIKATERTRENPHSSLSQVPSGPFMDGLSKLVSQREGNDIIENPTFMQANESLTSLTEDQVLPTVRKSSHSKGGSSQTSGKIFFSSEEYRVLESAGTVSLIVKRDGGMGKDSFVEYYTEDGTGLKNKDYLACNGILHFKPFEVSKTVLVGIVDDDVPEPDVTFGVRLRPPMKQFSHPASVVTPKDALKVNINGNTVLLEKDDRVTLDYPCYSQVIILDDDDPGLIAFSARQYELKDSEDSVIISVSRTGGACGEVSCDYFTSNGSAMVGVDYEQTIGTLHFGSGVIEASFEVRLVPGRECGEECVFHVHLKNPGGLASLGKGHVSIVKIVVNESLSQITSEVHRLLATKEKFLRHTASWREQFRDAMVPGVGVDELGEETEPGTADYVLHFLTFGWKVLFAFVPPASYCGGWVAFFTSLVFIGALTAVVGELAALFGCAMGLKDSVTAITFVALGTSLPDTFASRQAAVELPHADASIGNVTGSNTVNVLLGLGMPWVIGALYYKVMGKDSDYKYCVPSAALGYSVLVFTCAALVCLSLLMWRRNAVGGELGGTYWQKRTSSIFTLTLWLSYLILSSLQSYGHITFGKAVDLDNFGCDCSKAWSSLKGCPIS